MDHSNEPSKPTALLQSAAETVKDTACAAVEKVKCWYYGTNEDDFRAQIKDATDILDRAGTQMSRLREGADERVTGGLGHIQEYRRKVQDFNRRMSLEAGESAKPEQLEKFKNEWKCEMKKMYENGLVDVKGALDKLKPSE